LIPDDIVADATNTDEIINEEEKNTTDRFFGSALSLDESVIMEDAGHIESLLTL
jgi:hypothetical protein